MTTFPTATAGALGLLLLCGVSGCGRQDQSAAAPPSDPGAAEAAASSAAASASDAQASAALARANVPAAGTVANAAGENQKTPPPAVSVAEQAQAGGEEAPQELRAKVDAARDARKPSKP